MANMTLKSYLHQASNAYDAVKSDRVSELLSLEDAHVLSSKLLVDGYQAVVEETLSSPLADMVALHLHVLDHVQNRKMDRALQAMCELGQYFCKEFQSQKEDNWGLPIMEKICQDLRRVALSARMNEDPIVRSEDNAPTSMEKAADVIMALFRVCAADTRTQENETKRWGMLVLVNHLFKIYFRINRLGLCKPLIRAIEAQSLKDRFPVEQMVTYKYYVGRKAMFDSEFKVAEQCLTYAFQHCSSSGNKSRILTYLVPVKMFLGWLPTKEALSKYGLLEFYDVANALKDGNVRQFDLALQQNRTTFIKNGVYLILAKLKMLLYRNLFKKVCLINGNHQVPIKTFEIALKWSGYDDIDVDETLCITANLIFEGQIRGYISHQHQVLVVAKQNPFPKLSNTLD